MRLSRAQQAILVALVSENHLKSHRSLDGSKVYRLHTSDGAVQAEVAAADVERLRELGLIVGNMKFPAATYLLTEQGLAVAATLTPAPRRPLTVA